MTALLYIHEISTLFHHVDLVAFQNDVDLSLYSTHLWLPSSAAVGQINILSVVGANDEQESRRAGPRLAEIAASVPEM